MFYSKKNGNKWLLLTSALLGGFALGFTYKKYAKQINSHIKKLTDRDNGFEDYMTSPEQEP